MKALLIFSLCFFFFCSFIELNAQSRIDSLHSELSQAKEDTNKANILYELSKEMLRKNLNKANEFAQQTLNLSIALNWKEGAAKSYNLLSVIMIKLNKQELALENAEKALKLSEELGDKRLSALVLGTIANTYNSMDERDKALEYYQKSTSVFRSMGDKIGVAKGINNMASIYYFKGTYDQALENYNEAIRINEELGNLEGVASNLGNIGLIFSDLKKFDIALDHQFKAYNIYEKTGNKAGMASSLDRISSIYKHKGKYNLALKYARQSISLAESMKDKKKVSEHLHNMGTIFSIQGQYKKAVEHYQKALRISEELGDRSNIANFKKNLSLSFLDMGKDEANKKNQSLKSNQLIDSLYDIALKYALEAAKTAEEISDTKFLYGLYHLTSSIYEKLNDHKSALTYFEKFQNTKDSVIFMERMLNTDNVVHKMEMRLKENENVLLKKTEENLKLTNHRNILYFSIGILVLMFFTAILFYSRMRLRNKHRDLEIKYLRNEQEKNIAEIRAFKSRLQALQLQMNPHFIFNSLNSIQYLILKNNKQDAAEFLSRFAKLMRGIIENSARDSISLSKELEFLNIYLDLERLRLKEKFDFKFDIDPSIDLEETLIPSMMLQPFVENAIVHGIMNKDDKGQIDLQIRSNNEVIKCIIRDNGVGREKAQEISVHYNKTCDIHFLSLIQERLEIQSLILHKQISFDIHDLMNDNGSPAGTEVELEIPMNRMN